MNNNSEIFRLAICGMGAILLFIIVALIERIDLRFPFIMIWSLFYIFALPTYFANWPSKAKIFLHSLFIFLLIGATGYASMGLVYRIQSGNFG